jgi:ketosteroid isomerase-like protein
MCRTMIAGVTALLMLGIALAQTSDEASLRQAEKDWNAAISKQDMAAVTKFMADDYVLINVLDTGPSTTERAEWLRNLAAMRIISSKTEVTRVRVYGHSAVVSVKGSWHVVLDGEEIDGNYFVTDVWTKHPDGWKVVLRHSGRYPK